MATIRQNIIQASGTSGAAFSFSVFSQWASSPGAALSTFGWIQAGDTGQVQWITITCSITNAVSSSGFATYTFSGATAPLRNGMSIAVAGCTNTNFNITGNIVNLSGTTSGTFQLALASTNTSEVETATGTVTASSATPALSAFPYYEIWKANDSVAATTPFYIKLAYGQGDVTARCAIQWSFGLGSDGKGNLIGSSNVFTIVNFVVSSFTILYDCLFSGDAGRFQMLLWHNSTDKIVLSFERSKDSSGNDNSDFIYGQAAWARASNATREFGAQAIMTNGGIGPLRFVSITTSSNSVASLSGGGLEGCGSLDTTTQFAGALSVFPPRPLLGYERNPLLGAVRGAFNEWTDGDITSISIYPGAPHTYFVSKQLNFFSCLPLSNALSALLMRYE